MSSPAPVVGRCRFGPFLIDLAEQELRRDGALVPLTPKAFALLAALLEKPGRVMTKDELLQRVWPDTFVEEANLAYHVFALRKALGDVGGNEQFIQTVPKRGYRFRPVLEPEVASAGNGVRSPADSTVTEVPRTSGPSPSAAPRFWPRRAAIVLLAFAALTWFVAASWQRLPAVDPPAAVPLTSLRGMVRQPSMSPDGEHVAFTWTATEGNQDIWVQQIGVGNPLQLTTDPAQDYSPRWSPDGRSIAFLRRTAPTAASEVIIVAPLGGTERKVTEVRPAGGSDGRPMSVAWCPDSTCLVVGDSPDGRSPDGLFVVSVEDGEKRRLTSPTEAGRDRDAAVARDGRSVIFRRDSTPFSGAFYRLALTSSMMPDGEPLRLTTTLNAGAPIWMLNGREVLFSARGALWRLDALNGGQPQRLPFVGQDGLTPAVARMANGRDRLVYVRSFADTNLWRIDTSAPGARTTSPPVLAIASTRVDMIPDVSPDGGRVAFVSSRSGELEIWVSAQDGSKAIPLTGFGGLLPGFPRWSPDGQRVVFHADPQARPDALIVSAAGGKPTILTSSMPNAGFPNFSRDGKWIYFTVVLSGESRIWKMPASGGAAVRVTDRNGTMAMESPDGRDLYTVTAWNGPGAVWRHPLAGGAASKVIDDVVTGNFYVVDAGIYYVDQASAKPVPNVPVGQPVGDIRLRFFDFATGRTVTVAEHLGPVGYGLSATRDGKTVFLSRTDSATDELMLVDDFR